MGCRAESTDPLGRRCAPPGSKRNGVERGKAVLFVGVDWAEDHHDVCVMDQAGEVLAKRRIANGVEGVG